MSEGQSRRNFLGVGLGCAAPLLLATPLGAAGTRVLAAASLAKTGASSKDDDPVAQHILDEILAVDRLAKSGKLRGEDVRSVAANLRFLSVHLRSKGSDKKIDSMLQRLVRDNGPEATTQQALHAYARLGEKLRADHGVALPEFADVRLLRIIVGMVPQPTWSVASALGTVQQVLIALGDKLDAQAPSSASAKAQTIAFRPRAVAAGGQCFDCVPDPLTVFIWDYGWPGAWGCSEWYAYGNTLMALASFLGMAMFVEPAFGPVAAAAGCLAGMVQAVVGTFC